jgi:hypothetical protein
MPDLTVDSEVDTFLSQTTQATMRTTGLGIWLTTDVSNTLAVSGTTGLTLSASGSVTATFPGTGTVVMLTASQTLTSKTLTAPVINAYTMTGTGTIAAGCTLTSPALVTPTLGVATCTTLNGMTVTSSTGVFTLTNGKTLAVTNSLTLAGTDGNTITFPSGSDTVVMRTATQTLTGKTLTSPVTSVNSVELSGSGALELAGAAGTLQITGVSTLVLDGGGTLSFSAAGASVITVPATTDTMVLAAEAQTLSSKTLTSPVINAGTGTSLTMTGAITSSSATGGIGYATGAGGAVTQAGSRTTAVVSNTVCGSITLVSAAGTTSWQTFQVTNSTVAATDTIIVVQKSGTDLNEIHVTNVQAGQFNISFKTTGGTTVEQPVFNFSVINSVAA